MANKTVLAIIDIPLNVMSFLRGVSEDDQNNVVFTLFWALTDVFENMDMAEGSFEGYCRTQFAEWANSYYLDGFDHEDEEDQREYSRLYDIFDRFHLRVDENNSWRYLTSYFYNALERYGLAGEDAMYDVACDCSRRRISILVESE